MSESVVFVPEHTAEAPEIAAGVGFIVSLAVLLQPVAMK
jgi:hypothetical protein